MEYTSIYGYIKIDRDYHKSVDFIKTLEKDNTYPFINTNMFSFGDHEVPYYYENILLGFAATYKYFGMDTSDWNDFILKMEHILRNIDFENAQFHVESALGDYTLFWANRKSAATEKNEADFLSEYRLIKTEEWYFGFGKRSPFIGYPDDEITDSDQDLRNKIPDFVYPVPKKIL